MIAIHTYHNGTYYCHWRVVDDFGNEVRVKLGEHTRAFLIGPLH
jgi:hypothetical protein